MSGECCFEGFWGRREEDDEEFWLLPGRVEERDVISIVMEGCERKKGLGFGGIWLEGESEMYCY